MYENTQSKLRPLVASVLQLELDNHGLLALKFWHRCMILVIESSLYLSVNVSTLQLAAVFSNVL